MQYVLLSDPAKQLANVLTSEGRVGLSCYFSKEPLEELKKAMFPKDPHPGEPTDISTNDTLTALCWRSVMAARYTPDKFKSDKVLIFNMAVDQMTAYPARIDEGPLGKFHRLCWDGDTPPQDAGQRETASPRLHSSYEVSYEVDFRHGQEF